MDTTNFIKSLNSLTTQELYRVKDNIIEQLNIVESLVIARHKEADAANNVVAPAQSTSQPEQNVHGVWTREQIDAKLRTSDEAVERAIIRLFEMQTADEQRTAQANHNNGIGFNKGDAPAGSAFARYLLGFNWRNERAYEPKSLNHPHALRLANDTRRRGWERYCHGERPIDRARKIALKHSAQLVAMANAK